MKSTARDLDKAATGRMRPLDQLRTDGADADRAGNDNGKSEQVEDEHAR
jgi:hypothetical protein